MWCCCPVNLVKLARVFIIVALEPLQHPEISENITQQHVSGLSFASVYHLFFSTLPINVSSSYIQLYYYVLQVLFLKRFRTDTLIDTSNSQTHVLLQVIEESMKIVKIIHLKNSEVIMSSILHSLGNGYQR